MQVSPNGPSVRTPIATKRPPPPVTATAGSLSAPRRNCLQHADLHHWRQRSEQACRTMDEARPLFGSNTTDTLRQPFGASGHATSVRRRRQAATPPAIRPASAPLHPIASADGATINRGNTASPITRPKNIPIARSRSLDRDVGAVELATNQNPRGNSRQNIHNKPIAASVAVPAINH